MRLVARLQPAVSAEQADARLGHAFADVVSASSLPPVEIQQAMSRLVVTPSAGLSEHRAALARPAWILFAIAAIVLIAACANVAGLMLTRAKARRRDTAIRAALGATRSRIVRDTAIEGLAGAGLGAAGGLVLANLARTALLSALWTGADAATLDATIGLRAVAFTGLLLGTIVVLCGILPGLAATGHRVADVLTSPGAGTTSKGQRRLGAGRRAGGGGRCWRRPLLAHSFVNLKTRDTDSIAGRCSRSP